MWFEIGLVSIVAFSFFLIGVSRTPIKVAAILTVFDTMVAALIENTIGFPREYFGQVIILAVIVAVVSLFVGVKIKEIWINDFD